MGPREQTQVINLGGKCLDPADHLAGPFLLCLFERKMSRMQLDDVVHICTHGITMKV